jgi:hypothetical protein
MLKKFAAETHPADKSKFCVIGKNNFEIFLIDLVRTRKLRVSNNNNNNVIQFFVIYVLSQQL